MLGYVDCIHIHSETEPLQQSQTDFNSKYPLSLAPRGETYDKYQIKGGNITALDPYRFMEDVESNQTKSWIAAEANLTKKFFSNCDQRDAIKQSLTENMNYQKISLPVKRGDHYYFSFNSGLEDTGKTFKINKPGDYKINPKNPTEGASVFFDPKTMLSADGKDSKGDSSWTDDYKMVAMTIQHAGSDWGTIKVMDADTRKFHEKDVIQWTKHTGITWTQDSKGFFYQAYDAPKSSKDGIQDGHAGQETDKLENQKVYYHYLGTDQKDDVLIF